MQLPALPIDGDPAEQIAAVEAALDRDLADDFGQLVVYRSAAVANAPASVARTQQVIAFAQRARWLIIVGCLIALAGALLLARNRWRALALLGLGTLVATVATGLLVEHVVDRAPLVVDAPGGQAAIASITDGAIDPLRALLVAGSVIGAVLAALGVVATVLRDRRAPTAGDGEHG